ncbi:Protein of unknown function (DUF3486) [Hoeflea phototrophica DFL-43]|uniref:DUF3486 family protein n=1 Tax=Hoeflea phototrophica (strain DSM 17068 / NCIMB 14078 / DFL-43) TaxID=411684 RepID=A9D2W2_HOEPD|nr:phage protein Gp27 family protein [Hoeflea phototrophica]EDQ34285.1 Protein of unknown function (DUF3486) [Hoeflea phototrophica DFL-43]
MGRRGQRGSGRHALSSIDLLPEDATADIQWAIKTLEEGKRTDSDILFEFNDRLAVIGHGPVSKSAFGRYALKKRLVFAGTSEFRIISAAFAREYGPGDTDELTLLLVQMLMTAIYKFIASRDAKPKEIMEMSHALRALLNAQRSSAENRAKHDAATRKKMDEVFDAAETALTENSRPDGAAVLKSIREDVYGIFES